MSGFAILTAAAAEDPGPTWLAVIGAVGLGSVLSAAITAGSLIYQNRKNGEREARRRDDDAEERRREREHSSAEAEKEREHARQLQREAADRTQADALADKWREERREAHVALLAQFQEGLALVTEGVRKLTVDINGKIVRGEAAIDCLSAEFKEELREKFATVSIIGSRNAREAADRFWTVLNGLDLELWLYTIPNIDSQRDRSELSPKIGNVDGLLETYVSAVRVDLGTAD